MSISVLYQTYGAEYAPRFLQPFRDLANQLAADFVIVGDGDQGYEMACRYADKAVRINMQRTPEEGVLPGVEACRGKMILRFDDDETMSDAMREWILARQWQTGWIYSFPYAWLWGDDNHFITSPPFWTDPHSRLMPRELMAKWGVQPHSGNIFGLGMVVPVAHCHHKFLVQSKEHRERHAAKLDAQGNGWGLGEHYGKFMFPERVCQSITVREVGSGNVGLDEWVNTGEQIDFSTTW